MNGGCQCGAIRYRISGRPLTLYLCHCHDCQKQSAGAFGMSLWIRREDFRLTQGEPKRWTTRGDSGEAKICAFCQNCGTRIYHASDDEETPYSLKAGTLDDTSGLRPIAHIWTRRAQPWTVPLMAGVSCYEGEATDEELLRLWRERRVD